MNKWIKAFRLRTLPLALSSIFMGGFVAMENDFKRWDALLLAVLTTLLLQILSNLANDYGDFVKGTDNEDRLGPERALQSGQISRASMKRAIFLLATLSFISGLYLIFLALGDDFMKITIFLVIGLAAILAAIRYTVGKSAYGYSGLGDLFVFLFFGWVAVFGSYFLISLSWDSYVLMPATTMGMFSAAILNLNNLRDHKNDKASGKNTVVVKMGFENARYYHLMLLSLGWVSFLTYLILWVETAWAFLIFLSMPFYIRNIITVFKVKNEKDLDPELKKLALSITLFTLLFGIGIMIG